MYSYCDTEQHVRSQEAIPCDNPFTYESLHAGFPPILELILGIVKVTYAHYQKKKKKPSKDIQVYEVESEGIPSSLHLFASFMWHRRLLFLLAAPGH